MKPVPNGSTNTLWRLAEMRTIPGTIPRLAPGSASRVSSASRLPRGDTFRPPVSVSVTSALLIDADGEQARVVGAPVTHHGGQDPLAQLFDRPAEPFDGL